MFLFNSSEFSTWLKFKKIIDFNPVYTERVGMGVGGELN